MMRELGSFIVSVSMFMALVAIGVIQLEKYSCLARWENSGMTAQFGIMQGCIIKNKAGNWIPESAYMEIGK